MSARADVRLGTLVEVAGSVVRAERIGSVALGDAVHVGRAGLLGEVIALDERLVTVQVYEETAGLAPGEPLTGAGLPLSIELGPGLLGGIFDGVGRPLPRLALLSGDFMRRGAKEPTLDRDRIWEVTPKVAPGDEIAGGAVLAEIPETGAVVHRVLAPPDVAGIVRAVPPAGPRRVTELAARVETARGFVDVPLFQTWRVRTPRPVRRRLPLGPPLVTGQRVLDTLFPLPKGGAAGMPGGFGTGKTITQQQLLKHADADVLVYVGCGERGNEMTEVLDALPALVDAKGRPLADRAVLIANTSNMPVAAREASIYTGITIAEYYRDMGWHVALMADSTSRWAEALREISGRLEEMPAEEGYPPYLSSRLAAFYERAGRAIALCGTEGSVSVISAISPPGGDVTEPVSRHTQRFTSAHWKLDKERAEARVYPAIDVEESYGDIPAELEASWEALAAPASWAALRRTALSLLGEAATLERTARLVGAESLPEKERFLLRMGALFEEGFLRQSAYDPVDAACSPARQVRLLALHLRFLERGLAAIARGVEAKALAALPLVGLIERAKSEIGEGELPRLDELLARVDADVAAVLQATKGAA